jgi:hypothetical protein
VWLKSESLSGVRKAETDREPPHGARKKKDDDEFDNLYIDAQKITVHDPVLASAAIVTEKKSCQIRVGMPCRAFTKPVDP